MRWSGKRREEPDKNLRQDYLEFLKEMRGAYQPFREGEPVVIELAYHTTNREPDGSKTYTSKSKHFYVDELIAMLEEGGDSE